ncbi:MAG: 3-hydroxyacyl-ACP dehydratase FabZ [Elusimicrobiaceae bacterium]|nr:3-hydroxyacyl-ACP dehydratase FabZ [Elusimicrobiaceae bacterium]
MPVKPISLKHFLTLPVAESYGKEYIKANIPHREPFLLVDEIRLLEKGKKYIGVHQVRPDEYYFQGHFPGKPVMPGVLVIESMSQAFGGAVMSAVAQDKKTIPLFLSISEAKFRGMVRPGDTLEMPIEILRLGRISKIYSEAYVQGKLCAQATLNFILGDFPHD